MKIEPPPEGKEDTTDPVEMQLQQQKDLLAKKRAEQTKNKIGQELGKTLKYMSPEEKNVVTQNALELGQNLDRAVTPKQ